jgi:hypothetical protein
MHGEADVNTVGGAGDGSDATDVLVSVTAAADEDVVDAGAVDGAGEAMCDDGRDR